LSAISSPETQVNIQCPCGLVTAFVKDDGSVRFLSVPAFAYALDVAVNVPRFGVVTVDIGYGGAYYAIVTAEKLKLNLKTSSISEMVRIASLVTGAVNESIKLTHPDHDDLAFLYGTILTDGYDEYSSEPTTNICIFADQQVDRSPTGSGVTARIAIQFAKKNIKLNQERYFKSIIGTEFIGKAVSQTQCGNFEAVIVQVEGRAFYTGESKFILEEDDPLQEGFLIK